MSHHHLRNIDISSHAAVTASNPATSTAAATCAQFELPPEYGYVVIGACVVAFLCVLTGFIAIGSRRKRFFGESFMKQFVGEHQQHFTSDVTKSGGYPDMGNGLYAAKLPYNEWVEFNQAQRVHYNFLEQLTPVILFILVTGVHYPWVAVGGAGLTFVGRISFFQYISNDGASNPFRIFGALSGDIVLLVGFIFSVLSGLKMACVI